MTETNNEELEIKYTSYKSLVDAFFNKIKDYDFVSMDEKDAYEIATKYISPACLKFEACEQDLDDRDDELNCFLFELTKKNFDILVNYMVIEWLDSNYILTGQMLKSRLTTTDFHALNQYQLLGTVTALRKSLLSENNQLAINKSCSDSEIFEMITNRKKV